MRIGEEEREGDRAENPTKKVIFSRPQTELRARFPQHSPEQDLRWTGRRVPLCSTRVTVEIKAFSFLLELVPLFFSRSGTRVHKVPCDYETLGGIKSTQKRKKEPSQRETLSIRKIELGSHNPGFLPSSSHFGMKKVRKERGMQESPSCALTRKSSIFGDAVGTNHRAPRGFFSLRSKGIKN